MSTADDDTQLRPAPRLRVLVADDQPDMRNLLRSALESTGDVEVVGEAPDGGTAVRMAEELRPGAVISDLWMPVMRGDAALRAVREALPDTLLVLCSAEPEPAAVREALADVVVDRRRVGWVAYLSDALLTAARGRVPADWPAWERRGTRR